MSLTGKVPATMVEDNIRYYEEYIDIQLRQGKREEEVLSGLGDPRLLAKTVIEANKFAENTDNYGRDGNEDEVLQGGSGKTFMEWYRGLPQWVHTIMTILIAALILFVIFTVLQALFPIIVIAMIAGFLYRLFRTTWRQ